MPLFFDRDFFSLKHTVTQNGTTTTIRLSERPFFIKLPNKNFTNLMENTTRELENVKLTLASESSLKTFSFTPHNDSMKWTLFAVILSPKGKIFVPPLIAKHVDIIKKVYIDEESIILLKLTIPRNTSFPIYLGYRLGQYDDTHYLVRRGFAYYELEKIHTFSTYPNYENLLKFVSF